MKARKFGKYDDRKLVWLRAGREFTIILILAFILLRFVIGVSWVSGNSMYPTLKNGQPVVYNRLVKNYKRGDVVSVKMPSGEYMVKRIIAVAGDTVDIKDGIVYVNSEAEDPNLRAYGQQTEAQSDAVSYPIHLDEGEIFVMGDNREVSIDSRTYGPMSATQMRGRLFGNY